MAKENIRMPSSGGGIVRYFDDYKSKIQIRPEHVIVLVVIVIIIEIILHLAGFSLLGIN
ncbi:MAG: preprotein translocase subunit Sec61beta [Candidatus Woesearchaeota archaeon]